MQTSDHRDDQARSAGVTAGIPGTTVRASKLSLWLGPAGVIGLGVSGIVLAWLMLTGVLEPTRRYQSEISQMFALACGIGVTGLGMRVLVRACASKGVLLVVDRRRMRIETLRGTVDLDLDHVEFVTTVKRHHVRSLAVGDVDGNVHHPILRPAGEDWGSVADRLDEILSGRRASEMTGRIRCG